MSFGTNNNNSESKNLIIALVVFMAIMFGFNHFSGGNNQSQEPEKTAQVSNNEETLNAALDEGEEQQQSDVPVEGALESGARVHLENSCMKGAMSLDGGIIDSISLKNYNKSVEKNSDNVMLLSPKGTSSEFFYKILYKDKTNNETISEKTVWTTADDKEAPKQSIVIKTQTQNGLIIERTVTFDDSYLISINDKMMNISSKDISVAAHSELVRRNPETHNYAVVHEGLVGNHSGTVNEIKYKDVKHASNLENCKWMGYTDVYWLCSIINTDDKFSVGYEKTNGDLYKISMNGKRDRVIKANSIVEINYTLFTGPKDVRVLKSYRDSLNIDKFEMAIDFGWFFMITKPLVILMDKLSGIFSNMGIVILLLTLLFKILTYPLMKKSLTSAAKMKKLQPKMAMLQKTYSGDKVRLNQEMMALYKKEKVSPMSGCLPVLLQAPIFFCLYKVFFISIEMRHAPLFGWIKDLSAPDTMYIVNLFGAIDWTPPSLLQIGIWPLIMGVSMFLQQKLTTAKASANVEKTSEQKIQENMMLLLPVMFTYISSSFPVGVVVYWTVSNIFGIAQQYHVNKTLKV